MSQGGNLLAGYAQNPNQDPADRQYFPETDYTPSLSQSQINLKRKEKKITIIFGVAIAILVALLLIIAGSSVYQYYKNRPVGPEEPADIGGEDIDSCEHCLNLADLKRQAAESIESAKNYIHGRISAVTSADLKDDENQLAQIEKYAESVKGDANLKGQFEELLQKWRKLQEELNKALETNQNVSKLRDDYSKKVEEIKRLKDQVLEAIQNSLNVDKTKKDLQSQKYQLQQDIDSKRANLRAQREPLDQEIKRLGDDIARVLENAGVGSVEELDQIISKLKGRIDHVDDEKKDCTANIDRDSERISTLYRRLTEEMTKLGDIEVELIHSNWVQHVTETINKFKAIQEELRALKLSQLEDGKDHLYQAILALERKETKIAELLHELYNGDSLTIEEERLLNDPNIIIDQTTISTKRSEIKKTKSFQRYVENGKNELKVWGRQQFNTTFVTMKDIQDLEDIIEYFTNALKDYPKSPESLTSERDEQNNTVNSIRQQIETLEASIRRCQDLIRDSEATVAREQEKLKAYEKDRESLRTLQSQLEKKRAELKELESKLSSEIEDLERRKRDVEKRLADLNDGESKERRLRDLTNKINEKIASPPSTEDMEKAQREYQAHAKKAADAHREFDDLLNRIKANI